MHAKFEAAINEIGIDTAVPKTLLQAINEPSLTRENVASHLQKFREMIRKKRAEENKQSGERPSRKRDVLDLRGSSDGHDDGGGRKNARVSSEADIDDSYQNSKRRAASGHDDTGSHQITNSGSQVAEDSGPLTDTNDILRESSARRYKHETNTKLAMQREPTDSPKMSESEAAKLTRNSEPGCRRELPQMNSESDSERAVNGNEIPGTRCGGTAQVMLSNTKPNLHSRIIRQESVRRTGEATRKMPYDPVKDLDVGESKV